MLYARQVNTTNQNDSLSQIFELINNQSTVLDVGCATGGLAKQLFYHKQCDIFGIEQNPQSIEICKKLNIFTEISNFDLNNLKDTDFVSYKSKFDYIVCADVLEHLLYPEQTLLLLQNFLKKDGKIIISLPNIAHGSIKANLLLNDFTYTEIGILDKTHLHFYTYKSIAKFLSSQNLKIEQIKAITMPLDGWQPNKLSKLPAEIRHFISQDKHSHIMQYILLTSISKTSISHNLSMLENVLVHRQTNTPLHQLKRILINKFPYLLKFIEKLRLSLNTKKGA